MQDCQEAFMAREASLLYIKKRKQQWIEQWVVTRIQKAVKLSPLKILYVLE